MFDTTKPVRTRDGRRARILTFFEDLMLQNGDRIVGLVECEEQEGRWEVRSWQADGAYMRGEVCGEDLVNLPETVTRRVYLYADSDMRIVSIVPPITFGTKAAASVDVTFEIGKFAGDDE